MSTDMNPATTELFLVDTSEDMEVETPPEVIDDPSVDILQRETSSITIQNVLENNLQLKILLSAENRKFKCRNALFRAILRCLTGARNGVAGAI